MMQIGFAAFEEQTVAPELRMIAEKLGSC